MVNSPEGTVLVARSAIKLASQALLETVPVICGGGLSQFNVIATVSGPPWLGGRGILLVAWPDKLKTPLITRLPPLIKSVPL